MEDTNYENVGLAIEDQESGSRGATAAGSSRRGTAAEFRCARPSRATDPARQGSGFKVAAVRSFVIHHWFSGMAVARPLSPAVTCQSPPVLWDGWRSSLVSRHSSLLFTAAV